MISQAEADAITDITFDGDDLLVVHIRRVRPEAAVTYTYDDRSGSTPFATADMPIDDQAAARKVSDWLDMQG